MQSFSAKNRNNELKMIPSQEFDLLIIGGGITGAGIALDASMRGFKTLLIEKKDFAWGTSSRSTKLIHGGLRYLKQLEVSLVREVGKERSIVYKNAIHLVRPKRMLLPIIEGGSLGKIMSSIGLWIYDFLADVGGNEKRKMLDKEETLIAEPLLRNDIILGGGSYYEYRSDDSRLTIEVIKKAVEKGTIALNYLEAKKLTYEDDRISGVQLRDHLNEMDIKVKAKYVVNACGPWVDEVRAKDSDGVLNKRLLLSKGVHIVIDKSKLPIKQSIYFDVEEDDRMIFAIPRNGICYIGTTDSTYQGDINDPRPSHEDVEYLLNAVNSMFDPVSLRMEDVISSWAGLRPLIYEDGKESSELSRKDEIFESSTGLISIAGGKLTGYRKMSERVVNLLEKREEKSNSSRKYKSCKTHKEKVSGADFDTYEDLKVYRKVLQRYYGHLGIDAVTIKTLVFKYGTNTDQILQRVNKYDSEDLSENVLRAEVWYSIHHEKVSKVNDFIIRRTGMLYFESKRLENCIDIILDEMANILNWTKSRILKEKESYLEEYKKVITFKI